MTLTDGLQWVAIGALGGAMLSSTQTVRIMLRSLRDLYVAVNRLADHVAGEPRP
jgi:hypothetical protein